MGNSFFTRVVTAPVIKHQWPPILVVVRVLVLEREIALTHAVEYEDDDEHEDDEVDAA